MKRWFDSDVRYPCTIITHAYLLKTAKWMLYDYQDAFLWLAGLILTVHLIWSVCLVRKGTPPLPIGITVAICTVLQNGALNRITDFSFGSGLALFFYQVMLAFFWFLLVIALSIAYFTRKKAE